MFENYNALRFNILFFGIPVVSAIRSTTATLLWMLYKINWFMFTSRSNTSEMEYVYNLHNFHFKEIHTSCRTVLVLYWYILAFNCQMSYMESVYCLHKSQREKFIDSVHIFCLEVLSGQSPEI